MPYKNVIITYTNVCMFNVTMEIWILINVISNAKDER